MYREYSKSQNVVYTIDTENRVVVAKLNCSINDAQIIFSSVLRHYIKGYGNISPVSYAPFEVFMLPRCSYTGVARCHPDDEFDLEFGKKLALARAKDKYLRAVNKKLYEIRTWFKNFQDVVGDMCARNYRREIDNSSEIYYMEKKAGLY